MKSTITKPEFSQPVGDTAVYLFDDWFDPIEAQVRERVRGFIHAMIEGELDETLQRPRYGRRAKSSDGEQRDRGQRSPARPSHSVADRHFRDDRDQGATRPLDWPGRQDHGMEEQGVADLSAPHAHC